MKTFYLVNRSENFRKSSKNLGTCLAHLCDTARMNRSVVPRNFEIWCELSLIGFATVSGKKYTTRPSIAIDPCDHEKDIWYASRSRKIICGHRSGDMTSWIKKSGSISVD